MFMVGVVVVGGPLNERFVLENDGRIPFCENSSCP